MSKSKAILLDSDFTGEERSVKIKSGFCKIDIDKDEKYEFFMDKSQPLKISSGKKLLEGTYDLYILSWKSLVPLELKQYEEEVESNELVNKLKMEGATEEEIKNVKEKILKLEEKEGKKIEKFLWRRLVPVEISKEHWAKTELPAIVRETGEMRFLKALKTYAGEGGKGFGIGGKGIAIGFGVLFMALILIYSMFVAGVFG